MVRMLCVRSASFTKNHAQILRHREQHLAEALGLRFCRAVESQVIDLADAVDEQSDVFAKARLDLRERARRVLDDVMQQRRFDRACVEMQARENLGDGYRVSDIRLAAAPLLSFVRLCAELVRFADARDVGSREVGFESGTSRLKSSVRHTDNTAFEYGSAIVHGLHLSPAPPPAPLRVNALSGASRRSKSASIAGRRAWTRGAAERSRRSSTG